MRISSFDEQISSDNPARFIDAFVDKLDLTKLAFVPQNIKTEGRPTFEYSVYLKLYLYGYLNGLRSSRKLERECVRNVEVHWLLCGQQPNYHSIADFRKDNPKALKNTFKFFVLFLKECELIGGYLALIMTVYNLKRSLNILTMPQIMEKLQNWTPDYEKVALISKKEPILRHFKPFKIYNQKMAV